MDPETSPHLRYFTACVGRWSCPLDVTTVAPSSPADALAPLDRLSLWLASRWPRWLGAVRMHTTVTVDAAAARVVHTTRLAWGPVVLFDSVETFLLDPDGGSFAVQGRQGPGPWGWPPRPLSGTGRVADDARHATYELRMLGRPVRQDTELDGDVVTVVQTASDWRGRQRLVRHADG